MITSNENTVGVDKSCTNEFRQQTWANQELSNPYLLHGDSAESADAYQSQETYADKSRNHGNGHINFQEIDDKAAERQKVPNGGTVHSSSSSKRPKDKHVSKQTAHKEKDLEFDNYSFLKQQIEHQTEKVISYPSHHDMLKLMWRLEVLLQDILIKEDGTLSGTWLSSASVFHFLCEKLFLISGARIIATKIMPGVLEDLCCSSAVLEFIKEVNAKDCEYLMQQYGVMALKLFSRVKGFAAESVKIQQAEQSKRLLWSSDRCFPYVGGCSAHGCVIPKGGHPMHKAINCPCVSLCTHGIVYMFNPHEDSAQGCHLVPQLQPSAMQGSAACAAFNRIPHYPQHAGKLTCHCLFHTGLFHLSHCSQLPQYLPLASDMQQNHYMGIGGAVPTYTYSPNGIYCTPEAGIREHPPHSVNGGPNTQGGNTNVSTEGGNKGVVS